MTLEIRSKVGAKGQAVIPKPVRDQLGIRPGDEVSFMTHEDHIHVTKTARRDAETVWEEFFRAFPKRKGKPATAKGLKGDFLRQYQARARRAGLKP